MAWRGDVGAEVAAEFYAADGLEDAELAAWENWSAKKSARGRERYQALSPVEKKQHSARCAARHKARYASDPEYRERHKARNRAYRERVAAVLPPDRKSGRRPRFDRQRLLQLRAEGYSKLECALQLGVDPSTISHALRDLKEGRTPALPMARPGDSVRFAEILKAAAAVYGVRLRSLLAHSRAHPLPEARQVAVLLARRLTVLSYHELARVMRRNHGTLIQGLGRLSGRIDADPALAARVQAVEARIPRSLLRGAA